MANCGTLQIKFKCSGHCGVGGGECCTMSWCYSHEQSTRADEVQVFFLRTGKAVYLEDLLEVY